MERSTNVFPAHPVQSKKEHRVRLVTLVLVFAVLSLPLWFGADLPLFYYLAMAVYLGYLIFLLLRPAPQNIRYEILHDKLIIHALGQEREILFRDLDQWAVITLLDKLTPYENGRNLHGFLLRNWKWRDRIITLYATRKDRLVLLDTQDGVIGLSPAAEEEQAFAERLQAATGVAPLMDEPFEPKHARTAWPQWPAFVFFGAVIPLVTTVGHAFIEQTNWQGNLLMFIVISAVYVVFWKPLFWLNRSKAGRYLIVSLSVVAFVVAIMQ
ncbi:MAG TPA: PH domain-containing protein [Bacilli bacterium]|nr:PH domain-containing protein [Bacilli bacterium]